MMLAKLVYYDFVRRRNMLACTYLAYGIFQLIFVVAVINENVKMAALSVVGTMFFFIGVIFYMVYDGIRIYSDELGHNKQRLVFSLPVSEYSIILGKLVYQIINIFVFVVLCIATLLLEFNFLSDRWGSQFNFKQLTRDFVKEFNIEISMRTVIGYGIQLFLWMIVFILMGYLAISVIKNFKKTERFNHVLICVFVWIIYMIENTIIENLLNISGVLSFDVLNHETALCVFRAVEICLLCFVNGFVLSKFHY